MVEAWSSQSGRGPFNVKFDGSVYRNHWRVKSSHGPGHVASAPEGNPWRFPREATTDEMNTIGNPTSCAPEKSPD
ncbi:MAG: lysozyme [Nocardia sp.]|uniref:hypothetical protein n=1 Tax=Nocardia sp. TaxID=1821 RepID=UPI00260CB6F6|nr:hypothetical protein [Nocardia sp.]MCU1640314.1 lysozyme [Nocardia sp.]